VGKKLVSVTVRGEGKTWSFNFYADPKHIPEWREDGLVIDEVLNTVPTWAVSCGLLKPWIFLQDLLNFNNPFKS
jgi:hypothetical protein